MNPLNHTSNWQPDTAIERIPWTAESWYESLAFGVTVWRVIWVGLYLYLLGPAVGMAVIAGGLLAVWCVTKWLSDVTGSHLMESDM